MYVTNITTVLTLNECFFIFNLIFFTKFNIRKNKRSLYKDQKI